MYFFLIVTCDICCECRATLLITIKIVLEFFLMFLLDQQIQAFRPRFFAGAPAAFFPAPRFPVALASVISTSSSSSFAASSSFSFFVERAAFERSAFFF